MPQTKIKKNKTQELQNLIGNFALRESTKGIKLKERNIAKFISLH